MWRLLRRSAPVVFIALIQTGCCSTPGPDVSFAKLSPPPARDIALIDPGYVIYDLSRLKIGMTKDEVRRIFSRPHVIKQAPKDEYWEYDWFELYFREGRLVNWFDLPERRQKVMPSSQSAQAAQRGAFGGL